MNKFIIETRTYLLAVKYDEILYVKAESSYSIVVLKDGREMVITKTLKEVLKHLNPDYFFRCHRSYVINVKYIKSIIKLQCKKFILLDNEFKIPISGVEKNELRTVLLQEDCGELVSI
ncbi:MAG: LytTR family transcriptional regulator DNA-binding domain-containing protein [Bacteroidales bacterium]|nr:LytTR family transcriptional regulator DNA-binding domain-containing protein [Bacteroidales bacterium]